MSDKIVIDTNILVYSVANDQHKRAIADEILLKYDIVISPQVISEFVAVTLRKQILAPPKVIDYAKQFMRVFHVTTMTANTITSALDIMTKYQFAYWERLLDITLGNSKTSKRDIEARKSRLNGSKR